jgi:GDP-D-mannose 3', 5'-epimerase
LVGVRLYSRRSVGFIGSHLSKHLKSLGYFVRSVDRKENEFMQYDEFCSEFLLLDLRTVENCQAAVESCDWVFCLAADMGGMGFIQSNNSACLFNNMMISLNMVEASRREKVSRFFFSSSACVYPEHLQLGTKHISLKESDAWPARPQDAYGLEKLVTEECCRHYQEDFGMEVRIARFHNIYGPYGTWRGGREKAPAAFCRKAAVASTTTPFEVWGSGEQVRSFCYIDDCVEGIMRLMNSDYSKPLNLGSDESISMTEMANMVLQLADKDGTVEIKTIAGPTGVVGRNSDNTLIKEVLDWAPTIPLKEGLRRTLEWIKCEVMKAEAGGEDITKYASSVVVSQDASQIGI